MRSPAVGHAPLRALFFAASMMGAPALAATTTGTAPDDPARLRADAAAFEHGEGVVKDALRAFELYCRAAAQGDAESQYRMGWMYANGRGVERNDALAAALFDLAAAQGHAQARAMLAHLPPPAPDLPQCMQPPVTVAEYDDTQVLFPPPPAPEQPPEVFVPANDGEQKVAAIVEAIAPEYKVSPLLALAFIRAESNFNPNARSDKNAQGLMQLIPETSARFNVRKPYDPVQNIRGGLSYLRWLLAYFQGNVPLVAAAYNAGERTVERFRGVPPYPETRDYVRRILALFHKREHPFDPTVTEPSPQLPRIRAGIDR